MKSPLGDQTGLDDTESTSRTGGPPSSGTLKRRTAGPSFAPTAIHFPSGDHDTAPRTSRATATVRTLVPWADMHWSVERPCRRTPTHSRLRSGEIPTAPATAPSLGLQISVA